MTSRFDLPAARRGLPARGFTLLEVSIALVVLGLMLGGALYAGGSVLRGTAETETAKRLDRIEEALLVFATVNARLPCPTRPGSNFGVEDRSGSASATCDGSQENGVVPWRTLGLDREEALDAWGRLVTYRVYDDGTSGLVRDNGMNLTACSLANPPDSDDGVVKDTCTTGTPVLEYLRDKGLRVGSEAGKHDLADKDLANDEAGPGAAYILVSHGNNGYKALLPPAGVQSVAPGDVTSLEDENDPAQAVGDFDAVASQLGNFDDRLRWKGILRLAEEAGLGPEDEPSGSGGGGSGGGGSGGGVSAGNKNYPEVVDFPSLGWGNVTTGGDPVAESSDGTGVSSPGAGQAHINHKGNSPTGRGVGNSNSGVQDTVRFEFDSDRDAYAVTLLQFSLSDRATIIARDSSMNEIGRHVVCATEGTGCDAVDSALSIVTGFEMEPAGQFNGTFGSPFRALDFVAMDGTFWITDVRTREVAAP